MLCCWVFKFIEFDEALGLIIFLALFVVVWAKLREREEEQNQVICPEPKNSNVQSK